jgi:hypothetical protein
MVECEPQELGKLEFGILSNGHVNMLRAVRFFDKRSRCLGGVKAGALPNSKFAIDMLD